VPADFDRSAVANRLRAPRCAAVFARHSRWLTVAEWRRRGVVPLGSLPDSTLVSLIEPDGPGRTAYLLTTNYRSILDYNCSNFYALTVGLLADSVSR
jgi:membrane-bound lytic murein transglycosylase B